MKPIEYDEDNFIVGWKHVASNDEGTLARCSAGFILLWNSLEPDGSLVWPSHHRQLSAKEALEWLRVNVMEVAFPKPARCVRKGEGAKHES